jgi:hypothetical protein
MNVQKITSDQRKVKLVNTFRGSYKEMNQVYIVN